jgi:hypothetical protein
MCIICARKKEKRKRIFLCGNTAGTEDQEFTRFHIQDHHDLMVCVCVCVCVCERERERDITSVSTFETVRFKSYNTKHKNFLTHCHFLVNSVRSYACYIDLHKVHTGNNLTMQMFKFLIFCSNKNGSHLIILLSHYFCTLYLSLYAILS